MHITKRVRADVPRLRRQEVLDCFRALVKEARKRGVHTFAWVIQDDHIHWYARPESVVARGYRVPADRIDRCTRFRDDEIGADRFLRSVVGPTPRARRALLTRMTRGPVPWSPLLERLQPALPGL